MAAPGAQVLFISSTGIRTE